MPRKQTVRRTGAPQCDACGARIVFVKMTYTGRRMPVDPIPVADGNVCARRIGQTLHGWVVSAEHPAAVGPQYARYVAHFGTCGDRQPAQPKPTPQPPPALFDLPTEDT